MFFLYFFLVGLELLAFGAKVLTGCTAGELFGDDTNPVAGLMIGILATVLLQSSSTTTSIVVSLVGSAVSTRQGLYMIMVSTALLCVVYKTVAVLLLLSGKLRWTMCIIFVSNGKTVFTLNFLF